MENTKYMKVGMIHTDYPFNIEPRVEVKIRKGLPEGKMIKTPNISYKELGIDDSKIGKPDKPGIDNTYVLGDMYTLLDKNHLWKRFLDEYKSNLEKAKKIVGLFEIQANVTGYPSDLSWINDETSKNIYLGGCFLEGCLHSAIRTIQMNLFERGVDPVVTVIPEITLCFLQPAQVTFIEEVDDMNSISFHYKKFMPGNLFNDKVKIKSLSELP